MSRRFNGSARTNWTYRRTFECPPPIWRMTGCFCGAKVGHVGHGAESTARELARTDTCFGRGNLIKPVLKAGTNAIEISFESVLPYVQKCNAERTLFEWSGPHEPKAGPGCAKSLATSAGLGSSVHHLRHQEKIRTGDLRTRHGVGMTWPFFRIIPIKRASSLPSRLQQKQRVPRPCKRWSPSRKIASASRSPWSALTTQGGVGIEGLPTRNNGGRAGMPQTNRSNDMCGWICSVPTTKCWTVP